MAFSKWAFRIFYLQAIPQAFSPKSTWKLPRGYPNLEVFLSQIENELFKTVETPIDYSNLSKEEREL